MMRVSASFVALVVAGTGLAGCVEQPPAPNPPACVAVSADLPISLNQAGDRYSINWTGKVTIRYGSLRPGDNLFAEMKSGGSTASINLDEAVLTGSTEIGQVPFASFTSPTAVRAWITNAEAGEIPSCGTVQVPLPDIPA